MTPPATISSTHHQLRSCDHKDLGVACVLDQDQGVPCVLLEQGPDHRPHGVQVQVPSIRRCFIWSGMLSWLVRASLLILIRQVLDWLWNAAIFMYFKMLKFG